VSSAASSGNPALDTPAGDAGLLRMVARHSFGWLLVANLIGCWLAVLLLCPEAARWLGPLSYGRWMPVHMNLQLYGWTALPLVAWAIRAYGADEGSTAVWTRAAIWMWSLSLLLGSVSWLGAGSSGKLFLDWTGYPRVLFPAAILYLWCVLALAFARSWSSAPADAKAVRLAKGLGLLALLAVPFLLYLAPDAHIYPPVNPDSGGPTGASQLESTLITVLLMLLLPYGLVKRKPGGRLWVAVCWAILAAESALCVWMGRADASHHLPVQYLGLATLLVWAVLIPVYFSGFAWPSYARLWLRATMAWWVLLVGAGWWLFLPGVLDRLKFTDGLVSHSLLAMAGFVTSLLLLLLIVLLGKDGERLDSPLAFWTWNIAALAYIALFLGAGWIEGANPAFTMVPGPLRNGIYWLRLLQGLAMTAAGAIWLLRLREPKPNPAAEPLVPASKAAWVAATSSERQAV
jgi:cytochrome c oxidase cbb3-type subunit 1